MRPPRRLSTGLLALAVGASLLSVAPDSAAGPPLHLPHRNRAENGLTWRNVGAASHFVLDVGMAPGRTDLSIPLGVEPRAAFANVPPGTYFLRLRGGNEFGGGRPSSELRVVVP